MPKNLLSQLLCGATGKGSPPTGPVHSRLLRWWPLGRSMPRQVFSVFATPHFLYRVSSIIICLCGPGFSMIPRSDQLSFVSWSLVWMQQNFSLNLRVHFKVKFIAAPHPLVRFSPTVKAVKTFLDLSLKLFWSEWPMDLCRFGGKWGKCHLLTWLCPSPLNLQNPVCAMMKDFSTCGSKIFRSLWILLLTSPVTSITVVSKPRAMTKVGMTMSVFRQTVGRTSVFSGMDGTLFLNSPLWMEG